MAKRVFGDFDYIPYTQARDMELYEICDLFYKVLDSDPADETLASDRDLTLENLFRAYGSKYAEMLYDSECRLSETRDQIVRIWDRLSDLLDTIS